LVADLVKGKNVLQSLAILKNTPKRAAEPMAKLLQSALANAKSNFEIDESKLYISKLLVDEAPKLKRWRPRAMGRAYGIQKKGSHITLVLEERESKKVKTQKPKPKPRIKPKAKTQKPKPQLKTQNF